MRNTSTLPSSHPSTHVPGLVRAGLYTSFIGSIALLAGAAWWLLAPDRSPFGEANPSGLGVPMLAAVIGPEWSHAGLVPLAAASGLPALRGLTSRPRVPDPALVVAVLTASLVWLTSASGLSMIGYLLATAVPVLTVTALVVLARSRPRLAWALLPAVFLIAVVTAVTGGVDVIAQLAGQLGAVMLPLVDGPLLLGLSALVLQTGWAVTGAGQAAADVGRRAALGLPPAAVNGWLVRRRRLLTYLAAAALVPYPLVRLSWLTPFPLLAPGPLEAPDRLWGLLLGAAAVVGIVLTLGLIRPWGERYPRWVPAVGGREVPVGLALVPGGFVALVVSGSAVPMFVQVAAHSGPGAALMLSLLIPTWFWGPVLGLAVWAYVVHRITRSPGRRILARRPGPRRVSGPAPRAYPAGGPRGT